MLGLSIATESFERSMRCKSRVSVDVYAKLFRHFISAPAYEVWMTTIRSYSRLYKRKVLITRVEQFLISLYKIASLGYL